MKKLLIAYLSKRLLKVIHEDDLLLITNRGWVSKGRKLTSEEMAEIKAQAKDLSDSILWQFISKELEYQAFVTGRKARTDRDVDATFYMYYNLDLIQQFLDRCKAL